jgi:transcription elongation factor S-II
MSTVKQVATIKASLSKKLSSIDSLSDGDVESLRDMFLRLDSLDVTLDILTKTLIGTVVSKFKNHIQVGPTAKALVKKWKKVAKEEGSASSTASSATGPSEMMDRKAPPKLDRRSSVNSATEEVQNEWASLQPYRHTTCQKLHDILKSSKGRLVKDGINGDAVDHLAAERATEIEAAIYAKYPSQKKQDYVSKARSLCFNIKKNILLASQIILGQIQAQEIVSMTSDQLASDEKKKEMEERTKKLMESKQLDWEAQNESKINEMCGIKGELLQASLFTWYVFRIFCDCRAFNSLTSLTWT